jgi:hypothetical protein
MKTLSQTNQRFILLFATAFVGTLAGYLINQLPSIPSFKYKDQIVIGGVTFLTLVSSFFAYKAYKFSLEKDQNISDNIHLAVSSPFEHQRRSRILAQLKQEYILSHDGLTPAFLAGLEPIPTDWLEQRLIELGETWRQESYY